MNKHRGITLFVALAAVAGSSCSREPESLTAEDVVTRCAAAMGGDAGIETLRTLSFQIRSADNPQPMAWEIERPNMVRKQREGVLVLVFDGERAAFVEAPPDDDGTPGEPRVVNEEDWHHFEMDIALYVPAFFDYPATYVDTITVRGAISHLLQVDLPMGGVVQYAVDAASFLPSRVILPAWEYDRHLGDYREVGGLLYFHRYWSGDDEAGATEIEELQVNVNFEQGRFEIPEELEVS